MFLGFWSKKDREDAFRHALGYRPENTHGKQAWASDEMLSAAGKFKTDSPLVGYTLKSNRKIYAGKKSPHILTLGGTSKGKSTCGLMPAVLDHSLRNTSIVVPDFGGEMSCVTAHFRNQFSKTILVDPLQMWPERTRGLMRGFYNPVGRHWLNPAHHSFGTRSGRIASLCVSKGEGRDAYFYQSARQAWQTAIMVECKYGAREKATLPQIARIASDDFCHYMQYRARRIQDPSMLAMVRRWANPRAANGEIRSLSEVIETLRTETAFLLDDATAECLSKSNFTFSQAKEEVMSIYFPLTYEALDGPMGKMLKLWTGCSLGELLRQDGAGSVGTIVIADELYQLDLEDLPRIFSSARKFNCAVWGVLQDTAQLKEMHPKSFETVFNNTGCIQILAADDLDGSEHFSKLLGETEVYGYSKSLNYDPSEYSLTPFGANDPKSKVTNLPSVERLKKLHVTQNYSAHGRRLMLAQELRNLPADLQILLMDGVPAPVLARQVPYYATDAKHRARPNPYYRPSKQSLWEMLVG